MVQYILLVSYEHSKDETAVSTCKAEKRQFSFSGEKNLQSPPNKSGKFVKNIAK